MLPISVNNATLDASMVSAGIGKVFVFIIPGAQKRLQAVPMAASLAHAECIGDKKDSQCECVCGRKGTMARSGDGITAIWQKFGSSSTAHPSSIPGSCNGSIKDLQVTPPLPSSLTGTFMTFLFFLKTPANSFKTERYLHQMSKVHQILLGRHFRFATSKGLG